MTAARSRASGSVDPVSTCAFARIRAVTAGLVATTPCRYGSPLAGEYGFTFPPDAAAPAAPAAPAAVVDAAYARGPDRASGRGLTLIGQRGPKVPADRGAARGGWICRPKQGDRHDRSRPGRCAHHHWCRHRD